jgi:predicted nucleic acid-binding protein
VNGGFLLDTNIPSKLMRPRPEPKVTGWVAAQDIGALFLSVVSIGEMESGFTTMSDVQHRKRLEACLEASGASLSGTRSAHNAGDWCAMGQA